MQMAVAAHSDEVYLQEDSLIVSHTDLSGKISYANRTFMEISGYREQELLGVQHNIIRHPDMPRGVFRFLWDTLKEGREFFGFVKNSCRNGSYYWVFAQVTLNQDSQGKKVNYCSVRRKAPASALEVIAPIYREMQRIEDSQGSKKQAPDLSLAYLRDLLQEKDTCYERFIIDLYQQVSAEARS